MIFIIPKCMLFQLQKDREVYCKNCFYQCDSSMDIIKEVL